MNVRLFNKEYAVTFNMAVQIEFEDMSGLNFDLGDKDRPGTLVSQKATMQLCYASLKVANQKLPFTFDQLTGREPFGTECGLSVAETSALKNAVISEMFEWFELPAVMKQDDADNQDEQGEDAGKNA